MSKTYVKILMLSGVAVFSAMFALSYARSRRSKDVSLLPNARSQSQTNGVKPSSKSMQNLALQPEALKLSRRLGQRFTGQDGTSVIIGTLKINGERQPVQLTRRRLDGGERIVFAGPGVPRGQSWDASEGPKAGDARAAGEQRQLIERLVFDSPDQFVLAQLRGASYSVVARNVKPGEAGETDGYKGPLWDIVRIDDPETDADRAPQSKWRLYYINSATGLIDKIVTELNGEKIETTFSRWTELRGERFPSLITWTRRGQVIMELSIDTLTLRQS